MDWHPSFDDFGRDASSHYESQYNGRPHWQSSLPSPDWRSRHDGGRDDGVTPLKLPSTISPEKPAITLKQVISPSTQASFLPTPRSSLELAPNRPFPESLRRVLHKLQPLLKGELRELTIEKINAETFNELYEAARDDLPGWKSLR
jgi:hypothetical protein